MKKGSLKEKNPDFFVLKWLKLDLNYDRGLFKKLGAQKNNQKGEEKVP